MCPHCRECSAQAAKSGSFRRRNGERVQRFFCGRCRRHFCSTTGTVGYRLKKPELNVPVALTLVSGVSQRQCGRLLGIHPITVARKLCLMGLGCAIQNLADAGHGQHDAVQFDEMETFEHTKCKPLAIAVAVSHPGRHILGVRVAVMPAKGRLAALARKKYGPRADRRTPALQSLLDAVAKSATPAAVVSSDQCPRYPRLVKEHLAGHRHETHKGRRGCVVGQGELKRGGFDPLFSLNQTCAMIRDHLKRLTRRTWCTTKRPDRLRLLLEMYACYHNASLSQRRQAKKCPKPKQSGAAAVKVIFDALLALPACASVSEPAAS